MSTPRTYATGTRLPDGRVLVAGGFTYASGYSSIPQASAELYNPTTGTWTPTGSMAVARYSATEVLLDDGRVLVAGGWANGGTTATAELYNPTTGTWTTTGSLSAGRVNHSMVKLADGRVLVVGGFPNNTGSALTSVNLYNPATGQWTQAAPTIYGHAYAHAFLQPDGKVVVLGGFGPTTASTVEVYNPATNSWTAKSAGLVQPRDRGAAVQLPDGRILLAGGIYSRSTAEIYDPATGLSSATAPLPHARELGSLSRFGPGRIIAVGGSGDSTEWVPEIDLYDIASGTWSSPALVQKLRYGHTATPLDGPTPRLLIAGGNDSPGTNNATAEIYATSASDSIPPTVQLTSPLSGDTVRKGVTLTANAEDNLFVHHVDFYVDGALIGSDTTAPYTVYWYTPSTPNGSHTLTARAYDSSNNVTTSEPVTILLDNDKTPPTVTISSPAPDAIVSGSVVFSVDATDNDRVNQVSFYVDNTYLGDTFSEPYSRTIDTLQLSNGPHTLKVIVYDATSNSQTASVSVTVNNVDQVAPTVRITSPAAGAVSGTVTLSAQASDNVGVTRVSYFRDGTLLGSSTTAPYSVAWDTSTLGTGSYVLTALAYDAMGNVGTSPGVTVYKSATSELIVNGGFEDSSSPWLLSGTSYHVTSASGGIPASGTGFNELGRTVSSSGTTEQPLTLPATATTLSFKLQVSTAESVTDKTQWDRLYVELLDSAGTVLGTLGTYSNVDASVSSSYVLRSFSLSAYAGRSVRLRFRATNDSIYVTNFRIDDVSVK